MQPPLASLVDQKHDLESNVVLTAKRARRLGLCQPSMDRPKDQGNDILIYRSMPSANDLMNS